jgi:hypothetical protein
MDIFSPQQASDPWPPLPATEGAADTVTSHPHLPQVYCSPCFICIEISFDRIANHVEVPLSADAPRQM